MTIGSILAAGLLLLTLDDSDYRGWQQHLPLFARYDAHATFFPMGAFGTNELAQMKALVAAGHTVGMHTVHHRSADVAFKEEGFSTFWRNEVSPELEAARAAGLEIKHLAYPNNRHSPETDAFLAVNGFERFRAGVKDGFRYNTNGTSIVSLDQAFFPVAELPKHRVIEGIGVGEHYQTDIDDICRGIRRAAERDEVFALYSHDISANPGRVGMRTEWLEKILATAKECKVPVRGFNELGPVAPQSAEGPMTVYLTFDDGVKDHLTIAADELEKRGWRGFFCIVTDWIGKDGKLTWDDVRELQRRGHIIVNHTRAHKSLGALCRKDKQEEAREDIQEGALRIEQETGTYPRLLCLPGTDGDAAVTRMARAAGMATMLVPRDCYGEWDKDVGKNVDHLRDCGVKRIDFLVHGIRKEGGGWRPFATRADFVKYLDAIQAAEKAGKIVVSSDYRNDAIIGETAHWQAEIDRVSAAGGGRVTIPAGRHLVGQLELKNNVELHLEKGAVLEAAYGLEHYRLVTLPYSEGAWSAIIMGLNVTNVAVTGEGLIDGQGPKWPPTPKGFKGFKGCHEGLRPRGLFFAYSKDIRLDGYTLRNTPCWGQVFKNCDGVVARNITVFNHGNINNDGFDIEAKNVLIENCDVDTSDDSFCIKSNDPDFTVENVVIRNCTARGQASGFKIGTATRGVVRNVRFLNNRCAETYGIFDRYADGTPCDFLFHLTVYQHPESYPYGFALIGLAVECVDGGCVEDIVCDGLEFVDAFKVPLFVRADRRKSHHENDGLRRGTHNVLRNVTIRNVKGYVMGPMASSITGVKGFRVQDVRLENIDLVQPGAGVVASKRALENPMPYEENRYPTPDIFYPGILPAYGLYIDHADGVTLSNTTFRILKEGPVDLRPAIVRTNR